MSRADCISNKNIKIITAYVESLLGDTADLFEGLSFHEDRFRFAKKYFTHEDERTNYEIFSKIFRSARDLGGDPDFLYDMPVAIQSVLKYFSLLISSGYNVMQGPLGHLFVIVLAYAIDNIVNYTL